ncbi:HNH endonuclease [Nocardia sp. NPDC058519]|uniref:HNH endonuclease n=1 Tax=Nocardia sp. NPDC058519 TaxID=3346535 RepID=UPI0036687B8E
MAGNIQFPSGLWTEDGFRTLTAPLQGAFFTLCLRPELGALGAMPLFLGRIAIATAGADKVSVLDNLRCLALAGWIVLDEGEEELFVPRFMEFNGVEKNPNRLRRAIAESESIESPIVRTAVADVLYRLSRIDADRAAERLCKVESGQRPKDRPNIADETRHAVYVRYGWACAYCSHQFVQVPTGAPEDEAAGIWLELDHIRPYSLGGDDTAANLRAACSTCNRRRGVDDLDLWADKTGGA